MVLQNLIEEHHSLYIKNFGALKSKHHLMIHYPRIINEIGPLREIRSIRFEDKHHFLEKVGPNTHCRKNLLHTFAIKHQLNFANLVVNLKFKYKTNDVIHNDYFEDDRPVFGLIRNIIQLNDHTQESYQQIR